MKTLKIPKNMLWTEHSALEFYMYSTIYNTPWCYGIWEWKTHLVWRSTPRQSRQYYRVRARTEKLLPDKKITFKEAYLSSLSFIYRDETWCAAIKSIHQKHIIQGIMMIDSELASDTKIWVAIYQRPGR
jgi:hypothetical protein